MNPFEIILTDKGTLPLCIAERATTGWLDDIDVNDCFNVFNDVLSGHINIIGSRPNVMHKDNEAIFIYDGRAYKYFKDHTRAWKRYNRSVNLFPRVPLIDMTVGGWYTYECVKGTMLVDDTSRLVDYLNWMQAHSWSIIDSVDKDWTYNFYRDKTLARIKRYNAIDVERWIIGLDWDAICNKAQLTSYWHGDCSFENIVCPSAGLSVLGGALFTNIDWREDAYGDVYYDLAKLLKSIHFDHRTLTEGGEFKGHRHVTLLEDSLAGWCDANGYDWTHVRRIYALAVLAMSGSHDGAFGQALFDWGKAELEVFV